MVNPIAAMGSTGVFQLLKSRNRGRKNNDLQKGKFSINSSSNVLQFFNVCADILSSARCTYKRRLQI